MISPKIKRIADSIVTEGVIRLRKTLYRRRWWNYLTENDKRIILGLIKLYLEIRRVGVRNGA